jgi:hypothetical protein
VIVPPPAFSLSRAARRTSSRASPIDQSALCCRCGGVMALRRTSHLIKASRYMEKDSILAQQLRTQPSSNAVKSQKAAIELQPYPTVNAIPSKCCGYSCPRIDLGMASSRCWRYPDPSVSPPYSRILQSLFSSQQINPEIFLGRPSSIGQNGS